MKVVVVSFSGNVGKTTIAKHLFIPQMPGAKRVQIEDVNGGDGNPDLEVAINKFKILAASLNTAADNEHFVIDIGASVCKVMIENFSQLKSTKAEIDFWIIPVVPGKKQRADSLNTLKKLMSIGVLPERIVFMLNNITDIDSVQDEFDSIMEVRKLGVHVAKEVVLSSEIFELLKNKAETVFDLASIRTDFRSRIDLARRNHDEKELLRLGEERVLQDLAESSVENLIAVFNSTPLPAKLLEIAKSASTLAAQTTSIHSEL